MAQLTPQQYQALQQMMATGNSAAWNAATAGMSEQERNQWINQLGGSMGGGTSDATLTMDTLRDMGGGISSLTPGIRQIYIDNGILDPTGTRWLKKMGDNGSWETITGSPTYGAQTAGANQWSGTNAQGGFTGGTGTGITSPGVRTGANGQYSPVSLAELTQATGSPAGSAPSPQVGNAPSSGAPRPGTGGAPGTGVPTTPGAPRPGTGTTPPATGTTPPGTGGTTPTPETPATGGSTPSGSPWDFFNDEGYKFRLKEGSNALENSAAARGGLNSGATLKALTRYGQGVASEEYGNAFNRWANNRDFGEGTRRYNQDFGEGVRRFDLGFGEGQRQFNEGTRRWQDAFDYGVDKDNYTLGEDQRRWDLTFNSGLTNADANRNLDILKTLYGGGLSASNSYSDLATQLARIFSGNNLTGAGAGAAGNQGQANSYTQLMNALFPYLYGGTPTTAKP